MDIYNWVLSIYAFSVHQWNAIVAPRTLRLQLVSEGARALSILPVPVSPVKIARPGRFIAEPYNLLYGSDLILETKNSKRSISFLSQTVLSLQKTLFPIYLSICLFPHLSICPSILPPIHSSIHPFSHVSSVNVIDLRRKTIRLIYVSYTHMTLPPRRLV